MTGNRPSPGAKFANGCSRTTRNDSLPPGCESRTSAELYYQLASPLAASNFAIAVDEALQRLAATPESCERVIDNYRRIHLKSFPYHVIFEVTGPDQFLIVAICHDRRRPNYWRRRLGKG